MYRLFFSIVLLFYQSGSPAAAIIHLPENISSSFNREFDPSFSPNGKYVAFTSESEGDDNIWLLNLDNRQKRQITFHSASDYSPGFIGNSKFLFVSRRGNSLGEIYISDLKGKKRELIIGGIGSYDSPSASRDEKKIAYIHGDINDSIYICIYDLKRKSEHSGPCGLDPSFFESGDSLVFVSTAAAGGANKIAIYNVIDSSVVYLETGPGLHLNPIVLNGGDAILYENKSGDTNSDGKITISDDSNLLILDLKNGEIQRILPGFSFSNPSVSNTNKICAQGDDGNIYIIPHEGLTDREPDHKKQSVLCDSLIRYSFTPYDSLVSAVACYEAFYYYPENSKNLILRSALIYSQIDKHDIALNILTDVNESADPQFKYEIQLTEAKIRYRISEKNKYLREKFKSIAICENMLKDERLPDSLLKEVYQFTIELYFNEKMYDSGEMLIEDAKNKFNADKRFSATLERWDLKYLVNTYAGDINDLIPLHIELIDKFKLLSNIDEMLVQDLIELLREKGSGNVLEELEQLRNNYEWHPLLSGLASLEQARILSYRNRLSLAEWRLKEISERYPEFPALRFAVFNELFNLYIRKGEYDKATVMIDSASAYLDFIDDHNTSESFKLKAAELYVYWGYESLKSDQEEARAFFVKALIYNKDNYDAIWGLAKADFDHKYKIYNGDKVSRSLSGAGMLYLKALTYIVYYEKEKKSSYLEKAREQLLRIIDRYSLYPLPYLSVGYVDCLLEESPKKPRGLYEEAVEYSLKGISLIKNNKAIASGFYLNLGEAYFGLAQYNEAFMYYGMAKKTNPGLEDDVKFLMKYGESALHIDSLELARSYFQKLYNKSSDYGDEKTKAFSALKLGLINQMFEKYIEAAEYYEGARQYYNARKDMGVVTDIYKAQAYCLRMTGDDKSAITYADGARKTFKKAGYKGAKYDNRVKLILWPVGINIPLIELLPMRYGGSLYPKGFSSAAAEAFLLEMSDKRKDIISDISLKNRQINIFYSSDEKENSIDLWDNVGNRYFQIGYSDSSVASFKKAYKLCMELEEYHGAYIELLNWAEVLFGGYYDSDFTSILMELDEIESKALDLYDYIMPSYPNARANLKNVAGLAEYIIALIKSGSVRTDKRADIQGFLTELDNFTDDLYNRITRARYYFREALSELTPGEYPDVETGLLLNEAVASYSLGDFEGVRSSIKSARRSAVSSGSLRLYGMAAVIDAIINLNGGDNHIELLAGAVRLYEDVPINQNHMVDMPFLMDLYERIIEYYLEKRDAYSSMYYLESLKKMKLVSRLNRINTAFYKSERFKATLDLLQNYQKDVVDLNIERIRLEALGTVGKVKLREINGEILKIRSRILELRREIKELDPAAYSSLVFDQPSVKSLMVHIPKDEVCIVSQKTLKETAIWICRHDSLDLLFVKNLNEFENSKDISVISDYNVVTITAPHNIYWNLKNMIQKRYIGISIKRAYSLSEAYKFEIRDMRRSDGILIVRFDGHVLTDSLADAVGADLISYNSAFPEKDLLKYGWIIFDGKLVEEPRNFLLSYLKGEGNKGKDEAPERLYFKDIPDIKNNAFGLLFVNSGEKTRDENEGILVNLFENTGVQTVVLINDIRDRSILLSGLEGFFSGLMSESPIKSYLNTLNKESIIYPAKPGFKVDYYGEKGWSINDEGLKIKNLYSEYILVGNQYYIQKNWEAAEKYYKLALDIVINREFDDLSTAHAAEKLLETFGQSKEYNKRIEEYFLKFVDVFERTGDLKHMAKIYKDMASIKYDKNEYQESIKYSNVLIGIAEKLEDVPSIADGYAIRGKAFLETGELDMARADLLKAIELFAEGNNEGSALRSGLALAEIFNLQEMYGRAKMTLDSLNIKIDEVEEKGMYYKYLIQMSRYYMGTYRSEAAKKNLEYISEDDRNNAEATILLGKIYLMRGDLDSAFALAQRGKSLLSTGIRRLLVSEMHELMGDIYRVRGMNEESSIQYDLAGQAVMNYKYRKYSDILKYKGVLVADYEDGDKDSLYNQIISDSEIEFVKNLCRYQLGYRAAVKKDGERTQNHFEYILESKDNKTSRRLKWRALYILASIMETKEKSRYLGSAIDLLRDHSIEPDYIKDAYGLHEERADAFNHIADIMIDDNRLKSAINYLEAGYSEKISGRYFSVGNVDSMENDILNLISRDDSEGEYVESENDRLKSINNDLKYAVLWGEKPNSVEHLQDSLRENESVLRYFAADSNFLVAYMDKESIFIHEFEFKESDLSKLLIALGDLLTNQQKADSVMEEWYTELLSPVQRFLEDKEKILIVPDGILHFFPFETLKMPEGDYLSETFTLKRHIYLPVKFPADSYENMIAIPHIGVTDNLDIDLIQYIAEPFSKPLTDTDNCVKFYGGDFSFFGGSFKRDGSIICAVKPFSRDDHLSLALHSIMGARDGGIGFVYPLWDMSDEIKVMFYWKFLRNLADGKGFWNSFKRSRSYIFGHYDGLPDTWGAFVYLCLK